MRLPWQDGFRKVSKKARRGRKRKNRPMPHSSHRKKLPPIWDRDQATDRRQRLIELRERDLDDEMR